MPRAPVAADRDPARLIPCCAWATEQLLLPTWPGWIELETALRVSTIVYLATLGLIGFAAVRRTSLSWWAQLLALLALVLLGAIVIGLQLLAHS